MQSNLSVIRGKIELYIGKSASTKTSVSVNFLSSILKFKKNWSNTKSISLVFVILLITGLLLTILAAELLSPDKPDVFVGMDIGYGDEQTTISIVDEVADYVNLIVIGSLKVTNNTDALTRVCEYIYQKDLYFIVFVSFAEHGYIPPRGPDSGFFVYASQNWGEKFLGVYIFDEVGGKLIDNDHSIDMSNEDTYFGAATLYTRHLDFFLDNTTQYYQPAQFPVFTSDYALYWFDYLSGYDTVFCEFVANDSRQIASGLCRGAAKTLNKTWGAIITWSHNDLDAFIENPDQLYDDMLLAYQNGAKYVIVFNSPGFITVDEKDIPNPPPEEFGILTTQHLEKMQLFWNLIQTQPRSEVFSANTAYVLPADYGFGFRGPEDKIWGQWSNDPISQQIWEDVNVLLQNQTLNLDIVYETQIGSTPIYLPYDTLIFWNGTILQK
jgi:hypothetical protein